MFSDLNNIIENNITDTNLDHFCAIIGSNPSKGARSPVLWNKVFLSEKKQVKMLPLDVKPENFESLFFCLQDHPKCLGGAIAVPYKETLFSLTKDRLSKEVQSIGALNCFFRENNSLKSNFTGTNTDGEAALDPVMQILNTHKKKSIALIGIGGAGKAVLAFLKKQFGKKHKIYVFNRSIKSNSEVLRIRDFETSISDFDLIINATSAGSSISLDTQPFELDYLKNAKTDCVVYDIIYDPLKTNLLVRSEERNLTAINGLRMNLVQAVLAYKYTSRTHLSINKIFEIMSN